MTIETRTTIQLGDITEAEIECGNCNTRIAWPLLTAEQFIPTHCKKCDRVFFVENSPEHKDLQALLATINRYSERGHYSLKFSIGEPSGK